MNSMPFINFNGEIVEAHKPVFTAVSRGLSYGDGFFESIVMLQNRLPLWDGHWFRIKQTLNTIGMQWPDRLDEKTLRRYISDLAIRNEAGDHARIRLQFFREGGLGYASGSNSMGYVITADHIAENEFSIGKGLQVAVITDLKKPCGELAALKTSSALYQVLLADRARKNGSSEAITLNTKGNVCEGINSNVFLSVNGNLYTPSLQSGCVAGVMRQFVMSHFETRELDDMNVDVLDDADEIFLTNAVRGVQWVRNFNGRLLENKKAVEITAFLNRLLK